MDAVIALPDSLTPSTGERGVNLVKPGRARKVPGN